MKNEIEKIILQLFIAQKQNNFLELDYWEYELKQYMKSIK